MPDYPQYAVGCGSLLRKTLTGVLPQLNGALADLIPEPPSPVFTVKMGRLRSLAGPTVSLWYDRDDDPEGAGEQQFIKTVRFRVALLMERAGDDQPDTFELCRQVGADVLTCALDDLGWVPAINTGAFGQIFPMLARRGALSVLENYVMPDGQTTAEGFILPWFAQFSLARTL